MTGERPIAWATDAVPLLWEAFELLNDRPCFALHRDPARTSYALAAAIERFLDDLRIRHDAVLSVLPDLTSRIYLAYRDDEQSSEAIAFLLGLSAADFERRLDDAGMIHSVYLPETDRGIRIMLSSIELSLLAHVAFDPKALPAIHAGQRLNTIDADDSGVPRHAVPLDAWPEPLRRALAGTIVGLGEPAASQVDLPILYAARIVSDRVDCAA